MKMSTLVIHAPEAKVKKGSKSFEGIFKVGIGPGYAISQYDRSKLAPGSTVVLLRNDKNQRRAEGLLVRLVPSTKTPQGIQRYDVYFEKQTVAPYKPEKLNRFGVAVIDC